MFGIKCCGTSLLKNPYFLTKQGFIMLMFKSMCVHYLHHLWYLCHVRNSVLTLFWGIDWVTLMTHNFTISVFPRVLLCPIRVCLVISCAWVPLYFYSNNTWTILINLNPFDVYKISTKLSLATLTKAFNMVKAWAQVKYFGLLHAPYMMELSFLLVLNFLKFEIEWNK